MVRIEIISGSEAGKVVELPPGTHVVGRHPQADFRLAVESVSGRHLEIVVGGDGTVRFRDLGSTNGTFSGGVKVTEGEWFPGSEIKLGNAGIRLIDESASASSAAGAAMEGGESAADAAAHARAREAAMSGGRKGGPLMLVGLLVLVGGAGAAYWMFGRTDTTGDADGSAAGGAGAGAATVVNLDLIEDLGRFAEGDEGAWTLAEGVTIAGGQMQASGNGRRAALVREFFAAPVLSFEGQASGAEVWPVVEWGADGEEQGTVWRAPALGSSPSTLALPDSAAWFRVSLTFSGPGTLREFRVRDGDGDAVSQQSHAGRSYLAADGNLVLNYSAGQPLLLAQGAGGSWSTAEGGLNATPSASGLRFRVAPASADQPLLILSEGGPVPAAEGVRLEGSPGLLFGTGAMRMVLSFEQDASVAVSSGWAICQGTGQVQLRWELTELLTQASRMGRQLKNAAADDDVAGVLAAARSILRDYPLDPETVEEALTISREVLQEGRAALASLARERADAEFLQSVDDLVALEEQARALASSYAGSDLAAIAESEAEALAQSAEFLRQTRAVQAATYRARLTTALQGAYPLLADWLRQEGQS